MFDNTSTIHNLKKKKGATMKNAVTLVITALTAFSLFLMAPAAFADNGNGSGDSLLSAIDQAGMLLSANQTRTKDQKKDGSCLNPVTDAAAETMILAKGGHGPGNGTGNGGNGPKDGSGFGNKSGTCTNA